MLVDEEGSDGRLIVSRAQRKFWELHESKLSAPGSPSGLRRLHSNGRSVVLMLVSSGWEGSLAEREEEEAEAEEAA
jgi:hypothetical protein